MVNEDTLIKIKKYGNLKLAGFLLVVSGLFLTLLHEIIGLIFLALGVMNIIIDISKNKKYNGTFYSIILAAALAIMLILEYLLAPTQNSIFYVLLLMMSIGTLMTLYFELTPKHSLTKKEKIISQTGVILFAISFFSLIGIIYNNFTVTLIMVAFMLIMFVIIRLIRKRILKDNALKN